MEKHKKAPDGAFYLDSKKRLCVCGIFFLFLRQVLS